MNIPSIDGVNPERLLAIIEAIQKQREPGIEKTDNAVAETVKPQAPLFSSAAGQGEAEVHLPAVGRYVNIWV